MSDIHEELVKLARQANEDRKQRLAELFADQMKIGIDPSDEEMDVIEGDPGNMLEQLLGM